MDVVREGNRWAIYLPCKISDSKWLCMWLFLDVFVTFVSPHSGTREQRGNEAKNFLKNNKIRLHNCLKISMLISLCTNRILNQNPGFLSAKIKILQSISSFWSMKRMCPFIGIARSRLNWNSSPQKFVVLHLWHLSHTLLVVKIYLALRVGEGRGLPRLSKIISLFFWKLNFWLFEMLCFVAWLWASERSVGTAWGHFM